MFKSINYGYKVSLIYYFFAAESNKNAIVYTKENIGNVKLGIFSSFTRTHRWKFVDVFNISGLMDWNEANFPSDFH